jgi:D-inositol-3-phosphate glycosyltransferase
MQPIRVAMLSYHTCPLATLGGKNTGGMNVYVREITRYLGKCGVHVDVFTRSQDEHVPHVLHDLGYGNRIVHVPAGPEVPLPKRELADYIPAFVDGVLEFTDLKGLQYDLIHSHYWMSGIAALSLKKSWGVPIIQMFHTLGLMKNRVAQTPDEMEGEYRINGERRVMQEANMIVAATPAELSQLQFLYQMDAGKIIVIPPGVDTGHFYPIPKDEAKEFIGVRPCDRMLLFVGRIEPLKGLDVLLDAISLLRQRQDPDLLEFCLSVIGGDLDVSLENMSVEMAHLQAMREKHGLQDMVALLGKRGQDTLPYYYSASEAVVVPSFYESFGMVALEAMACGIPVVASHVGGLAFLVQDGFTGFTVPVDDSDALADRLSVLLKDDALRTRMGNQAAEYARSYGWENIVNRLTKAYERIMV